MTESGKGRPTPKRSQAQGRRTGPVPPPPKTRREAARRVRQTNAERRGSGRAAGTGRGAGGGQERPLLARDAGPVRRAVRDVVDSRRHPAVLLLPAALLPFAAQILHDKNLVNATTVVWLAALLVAVADFTGTALLIRTRLRKDHPDEGTGRHIGYGLMRITQIRRLRVPRPMVEVGDKA